ncbi:hypothetical protein HMPREF9163_01398 [Selenomonas sp. oral taxon 138 str. F0429]|nr:hypothetical protein HMPREF9163_01398 [Selenomonas sp. oral taxon 138 str. F0429]
MEGGAGYGGYFHIFGGGYRSELDSCVYLRPYPLAAVSSLSVPERTDYP